MSRELIEQARALSDVFVSGYRRSLASSIRTASRAAESSTVSGGGLVVGRGVSQAVRAPTRRWEPETATGVGGTDHFEVPVLAIRAVRTKHEPARPDLLSGQHRLEGRIGGRRHVKRRCEHRNILLGDLPVAFSVVPPPAAPIAATRCSTRRALSSRLARMWTTQLIPWNATLAPYRGLIGDSGAREVQQHRVPPGWGACGLARVRHIKPDPGPRCTAPHTRTRPDE